MIAEELKSLGKPEKITNKIAQGKLNKFKEENSLLSQQWVMEPKKVIDILNEINGNDIEIVDYIRIKVGE